MTGISLYAQNDAATRIRNRLTDYFVNYTNAAYTSNDPIKLTNVEVDATQRLVRLYANAAFATQPFTRETVRRIRQDIERLMPGKEIHMILLSILEARTKEVEKVDITD